VGGPVVSTPSRSRTGDTGAERNPRPPALHVMPRGANGRARAGTAKRRKRSAAGRAAGSRSALIVPAKPGNSAPLGNPVEGSGASNLWNRWRET
jgi:hypothetical protein